MLFRKCSGPSIMQVERYLSSCCYPSSTLIMSSSIGYAANPLCTLRCQNNLHRNNVIGVRTKCLMTQSVVTNNKLRRNRYSPITARADLANCYFQKATFMSIPGSSGAKRKDYSERRIMGFSMEQMYNVVADVDKYQDFLPWCQSSVVKSRRKGHILADLVVGFPPLVESYTSSVTLTSPHLIRAESTQGKLFNQLITTWKFSPGLKGRPQTCVVDFYVSFEFRSALTSQLANVFFNEVVRAMAGAFYHEAKRRYGAESIPSRKITIVPVGPDGGRDKP